MANFKPSQRYVFVSDIIRAKVRTVYQKVALISGYCSEEMRNIPILPALSHLYFGVRIQNDHRSNKIHRLKTMTAISTSIT
jgi:hypothetical protein